MSTFKGVVPEFPQIRIDYFRQQPEHKPPLACFLSHVHSDHLTGLESLRAPFVYCSAATREILLRLEKYHSRVNHAKGVLESRTVTYDRSMRKLAKPLPLDTPTMIELGPENYVRVTLLDANHCMGAVMFLIEGNGKAILYTGDIRAETWWVNSLVQNPVLLPYMLGPRQLDCVYLDTTFATKSKPYREFPSKAQGIRELLEKVSVYPEDTIFYFHSWTFGYENVWIALSAFLGSRIHVDDYRARIYGSLSSLNKKELREIGLIVPSDNNFLRESGLEIREAPALCGFRNGNHVQPGCLTSKESVRIHSCERGMGCRVIDRDTKARIVHIIPIITRSEGMNVPELGAGGGKSDLEQREELEIGDLTEVTKLIELCAQSIQDEEQLATISRLLRPNIRRKSTVDLDLQDQTDGQGNPPLIGLTSAILSRAVKEENPVEPQNRTIYFPYSRHSSYSELCALLEALKPMDVYPCTVDEDNWSSAISMQNMFGKYCNGNKFRHDVEMTDMLEKAYEKNGKRSRDQSQTDSQRTDELGPFSSVSTKRMCLNHACPGQGIVGNVELPKESIEESEAEIITEIECVQTRRKSVVPMPVGPELPIDTTARGSSFGPSLSLEHGFASKSIFSSPLPSAPSPPSRILTPSPAERREKRTRLTNREIAYHAAIGTYITWNDYGGLVSTRRKADREEQEL